MRPPVGKVQCDARVCLFLDPDMKRAADRCDHSFSDQIPRQKCKHACAWQSRLSGDDVCDNTRHAPCRLASAEHLVALISVSNSFLCLCQHVNRLSYTTQHIDRPRPCGCAASKCHILNVLLFQQNFECRSTIRRRPELCRLKRQFQ